MGPRSDRSVLGTGRQDDLLQGRNPRQHPRLRDTRGGWRSPSSDDGRAPARRLRRLARREVARLQHKRRHAPGRGIRNPAQRPGAGGAGGAGLGAAADFVQRLARGRARDNPRRHLLVPERRWLAYRGVPDAPSRLSPGEDLSPDPLHSRWPALELRQRILPRVPVARGTGVLGAAGEPARLYRIRPRVHVRQPGGLEDYEDLMKAVDLAIARGGVDSTRLGVAGGSYGGFMTNWVVGHTGRFAAAESDRSIYDWFSWYGSSDAQGLTDYEFAGPPWDADSLYRALSPLSYAKQMRTPLLIVHSEDDRRTPITDAEQLFVMLRERGVPTEFVRYPRSYHGLSRTGPPWLLVDRLERIRTWFAHWLGSGDNPPAAGLLK